MKHKKPFARKRFGQNFLICDHVIDEILFAANLAPQDNVIEIGPGRGALTSEILKSEAYLTAIEIDKDLTAALKVQFFNENCFQLIEGDVLTEDWASFLQNEQSYKLIANLPYNISTPLFFKLIDYRHFFKTITIMVQKEVAIRLMHDGTGKKLKEYGILSVISNILFDSHLVCEVPASCFNPAPKVDSAVIQLVPNGVQIPEEHLFYQFIKKSFNNRRKLLFPSLKKNQPHIVEKLSETTLQKLQNIRPENLTPKNYLDIYKEFRNL